MVCGRLPPRLTAPNPLSLLPFELQGELCSVSANTPLVGKNGQPGATGLQRELNSVSIYMSLKGKDEGLFSSRVSCACMPVLRNVRMHPSFSRPWCIPDEEARHVHHREDGWTHHTPTTTHTHSPLHSRTQIQTYKFCTQLHTHTHTFLYILYTHKYRY